MQRTSHRLDGGSPLICVFCRPKWIEAEAPRMVRAALVGALLTTSGCSYALHPHRTLEGRSFRWDVAKTIAQGTPEAEVVEKLGPPLEVLPNSSGAAVWRYHERAQLRGCRTALFGFVPWGDTPVVTSDATLYVRGGVVTQVALQRR